MEPYKVCPKCGSLTSYSYYFGAYRCKCGWRDESARIEREKRLGLRKDIMEFAEATGREIDTAHVVEELNYCRGRVEFTDGVVVAWDSADE